MRVQLAAALLLSAACLSPPDAAMPPPRDGDPGVVGSCVAGELIAGAVPFDPGPNPADSCGLDNVLERDALTTGLDRDPSSDCEEWSDGSEACSCVGLDLGAIMPVASFTVVAGTTGDACGLFECLDEEDGCGSGHDFTAWYGAELDEHIHAADRALEDGSELAEHVIEVGAGARYVAVCRNGWGEGRDDVAVDAIEVECAD